MAHTPGIGTLIGSSWQTLESLTPGDDRSLATMMRRWVFGTGPAAAPAASPVFSFIAEVVDGWTGEIVVAVGDSTYTITPAPTTSAVELLDRIVRAGSRRGGAWSWSMDRLNEIDTPEMIATISATVPFELILTGTARTRLGFLDTYAGQLSYSAGGDAPTAEHALHGAVATSLGLSFSGAVAVGRGGGTTQAETSAATGATGLRLTEESGTVRWWGTQADFVDLVNTLDADTWDVGLGGEWAGRVRIRGVAREPWGMDPTRSTLSASVEAVSL